MGQLLGGPVTAKFSEDGAAVDQGLAWATSGMQGWRDSMEDAHLVVPSLGSAAALEVEPEQCSRWAETALFAVMDGHGGSNVAHFCRRHFPAEIVKGSSEDVATALINAFHRLDAMLLEPSRLDELRTLSSSSVSGPKTWFAHPDRIGCTAVVGCVRLEEIIVANCGDSRAVMSHKGMAIDMSEDHKPNMPTERDRITRAGGVVGMQRIGPLTQYRVNGGLNLSRSIGDHAYKQTPGLAAKDQMIIATPEVRTFKRRQADEFMVIACDGVWDVLSSQDVVDWIRQRLGNPADVEQRLNSGHLVLSRVLEDMLDHCLSPDLRITFGLGGDNMTAVLVVFTSLPQAAQVSRHRGLGYEVNKAGFESFEGPLSPGPAWFCSGC